MRYLPTLTIAGSDSSGGAGIQADIKTMSALGCYAMSVITAVTAQNTCGVRGAVPLPSGIIKAQILAVLEDIPPKAIKVGMLYDSEVIRAVSEGLQQADAPLIVDPVMVATSGDRLLDDSALVALRELMIPRAKLITPNLHETEVLYGSPITTTAELLKAGAELLQLGAESVLIKGGHVADTQATDYLFTRYGVTTFSKPWVESRNTHGTGCTLSSAITAYMAQGMGIIDAVTSAKEYLYQAILSGREIEIGRGHGPVDHFFNPHKSIKE